MRQTGQRSRNIDQINRHVRLTGKPVGTGDGRDILTQNLTIRITRQAMRLFEAIIEANHRAVAGDASAGLHPADFSRAGIFRGGGIR